MTIKKNAPKEIGKKESFQFYNELVKTIKRSKFFIEIKDRRYDESSKKESVFDCPRGLVRLIININSVRNWKLKGDVIRTVRIEWFVKVFISRAEFDIRCPSADHFLKYVQEKIYRESIRPSIGDGFRWSINPSKKERMLNLKKYNPLEVAEDIERRIKDMIVVFDRIKEEVIKATNRIDSSVSKIFDKEKQIIDEILSLASVIK